MIYQVQITWKLPGERKPQTFMQTPDPEEALQMVCILFQLYKDLAESITIRMREL